jgi:hypothetical protein
MTNIVSINGQAKSLRNLLGISAAAVLGLLAVAPASAQTLTQTYTLAAGASSVTKAFSIPALSHVKVTVSGNFSPTLLFIDIIRADGVLLESRQTAFVNSELLPSSTAEYVGNSIGCPNTWKVRIRTGSGVASVAVSGTITFQFVAPAPSSVTFASGGDQTIGPGGTANRTISGVTGKGTGTIRIKAKWHTDPLDVLHFNTYWPLTVRLVRPDGTIAASQKGFSQHAPSSFTPKLNFTYVLTPADLALNGAWTVRMENSTGINLTGFNIQSNGDILVPVFNSTFSPGCN